MSARTAVIGLGVAAVSIPYACTNRVAPEPQIVFAPKAYIESPANAKPSDRTLIYVAGTLTGNDVGYPNNTTAIECYKARMECEVTAIEQIGENQVSRLDLPLPYPVTKWD